MQLVNSINFMDEIIQSLFDEKITFYDYEIIKKCIEYKKFFYLNEEFLLQWEKNNYSLSTISNLSFYNEVNQLMKYIVEQLKKSIIKLNRKDKQNIWYLIQALHNLPKVYLNPMPKSIFNHYTPPIKIEIALKCAHDYISCVTNN